MNPVWPETLPPLTELSSYSEQPPDQLLRTPMDAGPPKLRRRTTANVRPVSGSLLLHKDQVDLLDSFFLTDLLSGSVPFAGLHPRTGAAMTANLGRPAYKHRSGPYYEATITLEILP